MWRRTVTVICATTGWSAWPWWWAVVAVAVWNELWYATPVKRGCASAGTRLPAGHVGLPGFFGVMATFLWYFYVLWGYVLSAITRPDLSTASPAQSSPRSLPPSSHGPRKAESEPGTRSRRYISTGFDFFQLILPWDFVLPFPLFQVITETWVIFSSKVTFANIAKLSASFERGPLLHNIDQLFYGLVKGIQA